MICSTSRYWETPNGNVKRKMVQDSPILENDLIFLMQTGDRSLEQVLSGTVREENVRFESVQRAEDLKEHWPTGQIITFIIGSDVEDPVQSAQRLHAYNKNAKIILLAESDSKAETLKEAIRFSPFIGVEVACLVDSNRSKLQMRMNEILKDSLQAERYRAIVAQSNAQLSQSTVPGKSSSRTSTINHSFINKLMDIAPIGIAIVEKSGNVLGWNREAASIFNRNEAQVLGSPLTGFLDEQEGRKLNRYLKTVYERDTQGERNTLSVQRTLPERGRQVLNITAAPFTYSRGTEKALILTIKDTTESADLMERLKTEVTTRDNFLSLASHELRTPLTSMRLNLELLRDASQQKFPEDSGFLELSERSLKQTDRLNDLIEDFFDVAKIQSGKLTFDLEEFNLSSFVSHYLSDMEKGFEQAHTELQVEIEPDVTGVWDKNRIEQAFASLISNAIKYSPDGPVKVSLQTRGNWAYLSVHDRGPGISKDKQKKIFGRFERVTSSKTISGLGLGLFITKKIAEGHRGDIEIESTPGKGSVFTLKLPLDLDEGNANEQLGILW